MARLGPYLRFFALTCLVSMTCIILTAFEDIRKRQYVLYLRELQTGNIPRHKHQIEEDKNKKWFFWNQHIETSTSAYERVVKTKTEYAITATHRNPYLINNRFICRGVTKVSCLVMVHTSPSHIWRRAEMRRTWLNSSHYSPENVRVIFLLGTVSDSKLQEDIIQESRRYNDIIQGDFVDSYRNLTNKGVLGYRWITENCMNAELIVKVDDDAFINFFKLFEDLKSSLIQRKKYIFCNKIEPYTMPIIRKNDSKWFVLADQYRSFNRYPHRYCSGFTVFISTDLVPALYHAAEGSPFFWVDDFFLFGLLPSRSKGVVYESFRKNLTFKHPEAVECYKKKKQKCEYLVMPAKDKELDVMWKLVIADRKQSEYGYYYMNLPKNN